MTMIKFPMTKTVIVKTYMEPKNRTRYISCSLHVLQLNNETTCDLDYNLRSLPYFCNFYHLPY